MALDQTALQARLDAIRKVRDSGVEARRHGQSEYDRRSQLRSLNTNSNA